MKAKKLTGLLLAGALFAGVAATGTYSFFSDKIESPANLTIAMGNLSIADVGGEDGLLWEVQTNADDADLDTESYEKEHFNPGDSFANVRPGDVFVRTVQLENTGSLKQRVNVKFNDAILNTIVGTTADGTQVRFSDVFDLAMPEDSTFILEPGKDTDEVKEFEIRFAIKTSMDNTFNAKEDGLHEWDLNELLNNASFVTVTADQVNNK